MDLFNLFENYILTYLPKERGYSQNTVLSYYSTLKQFIKYLVEIKNIKQSKMAVYDFNRKNINDFLLFVENSGSSISTRNQKQTAIKSFVLYCAMIEPIYQNTYNQLECIKHKKTEKKKLDFMTIEEYKAFIECIDLKSKNGIRHYAMINLLYDTAARVHELINMKVNDISFGKNNSIRIKGKGNKYRLVYIGQRTVNIIKKYMEVYNIQSGYIFLNNQGKQLTRFGVEYIISKYYKLACEKCETLKSKNVTPHTLRHTKACHFLINGTSLPVIQRFLGHSSIQTTEIYLDVTSESIIKAVEQASHLIEINCQIEDSKPLWEDENIMMRLKEIFNNEK